ncbi:MAG: CPBP family intramembrane metalloprotease [Bacteroidales bacterium]|jgi:hypothetical protein|nr:CPBP family intramembrane metalloprotease [Bacteroidales bacterium]
MSSKLLYKISSYPTILIFIGGFIAHFLVKLLVGGVYEIIGAGDIGRSLSVERVRDNGLIVSIITTGIISPALETLTLQWLPIWLLFKIKNIPYWIPIVVSAAFFGWAHLSYSVLYMVLMVAVGYVYASLFVIYKIKKRYSFAFWPIFLLHVFNNAVGVIAINYYEL